ncbi:hypothetical protein L9F63_010170, partial [Diploptera punctata]
MEVCSEKVTTKEPSMQILLNSDIQIEEAMDSKEIAKLLANSKKLEEELKEEVAGIKNLKDRHSSIMFKLSDLQKGRAVIARNMSDTKIILERIIAAEENLEIS